MCNEWALLTYSQATIVMLLAFYVALGVRLSVRDWGKLWRSMLRRRRHAPRGFAMRDHK